MAVFNRKDKTEVPAEIQEYYQTEKRERAGVAWLLAFGTLVVTIVLAAGIFFAGRWAYRQIAGTDDNGSETTEVAQNDEQSQESDNGDEGATEGEPDSQDTGEDADVLPGDGSTEGEDTTDGQEGQVDDGAATTDDPSGDVAGDSDDQEIAATGDTTDEEIVATGDTIPDTGPGDTVAIFLAVSILGYAIHRGVSQKLSE
jgi:hypothetical protein